MFAILGSAFNVVLGFVFRGLIVKFLFFFALYYVTSEFVPILIGMLPSSGVLNNALGNIPSSVGYFLNLMKVPAGMSLVLSAYVTRFIIRRIPVIG